MEPKRSFHPDLDYYTVVEPLQCLTFSNVLLADGHVFPKRPYDRGDLSMATIEVCSGFEGRGIAIPAPRRIDLTAADDFGAVSYLSTTGTTVRL